ncbi:probable cytochrome P450 6a14 [Schistocerca piceifrons]|uniref:probable cytochrome P450 6a14 n=1 Tax=Schistocerca piceifrons TaxID=274613 RepID=UPI001F5F515E|nr:probable cytochrome P450 6a14 [Schistocerca piceifrons]
MAFYAESWLTELLVGVSLVVVAVYVWFSHSYKYWKKKGAPYQEPQFPFGTAKDIILGKLSFAMGSSDIYRQFKGNRFVGTYFFHRPGLVVMDPDLIRSILVKDFWTFQDRAVPINENEPLNHHLFVLRGDRWRRLRVKLTPTFTSGKMKMMFQTMADCGREMAEVLEGAATRGEALEMRELSARYTTDVIASVAFGVQVNCQRDPENEFRQWGRRIFSQGVLDILTIIISSIHPKLPTLLRMKSSSSLVSEYFRSMVRETVKYREENNITRNDFMQLMIQLKNKGSVDGSKGGELKDAEADGDKRKTCHSLSELSIDDVAAQAFVFFIAGFETSSTTMSFALHELAHHPDIQARLQDEIDSVLKQHDGQVTYEAINSMSYLDKVVAETLRLYPPIGGLTRECNAEYKIPDSEVVLDKGISVTIPVYDLHHDPEFYPDPERFDPERFSEEQKAQRHSYVYLPFGEGPRNCIGMRFGLLQTKVGLTNILSNYKAEPCEKTVRHLSFEPRSIILTPESGIQLRLSKRNKV